MADMPSTTAKGKANAKANTSIKIPPPPSPDSFSCSSEDGSDGDTLEERDIQNETSRDPLRIYVTYVRIFQRASDLTVDATDYPGTTITNHNQISLLESLWHLDQEREMFDSLKAAGWTARMGRFTQADIDEYARSESQNSALHNRMGKVSPDDMALSAANSPPVTFILHRKSASSANSSSAVQSTSTTESASATTVDPTPKSPSTVTSTSTTKTSSANAFQPMPGGFIMSMRPKVMKPTRDDNLTGGSLQAARKRVADEALASNIERHSKAPRLSGDLKKEPDSDEDFKTLGPGAEKGAAQIQGRILGGDGVVHTENGDLGGDGAVRAENGGLGGGERVADDENEDMGGVAVKIEK